MGFAGNLQTLAWSEVVQTLHRVAAEGVLRVVSPTGDRDVVFAKGAIIGVDSRIGSGRVALVHRLRALGRIAAEGEVSITKLVVSGQLEQREVDEIVHRQALEELFDLATWDFADFVFHESSDDPRFADQVARHLRAPLNVSVESVLLESARRADEWAQLKDAFSDDDLLQPIAGREAELDRFRADEAGCLVIPRLVGVRAVGDLLEESSVTRFELYSLLSTLQDRGLVQACETADLIAHTAALAERGDLAGAAQVYRRLLARDPEDAELAESLEACLDQLPPDPRNAACHAQLALAHLGAGRGERAMAQAERAVALALDDPDLRMVRARCLIALDRIDDAAAALLDLARMQVDLGRLGEARDSCLKVLELRPEDEDAKREQVRIHALTSDVGSEDVVVCAQCSAVNKRSSVGCVSCQAPLHLACLACARVVSVSDRICVFCGADPHTRPKGSTTRSRVLAVSGPSTDRIVAANKGGKPQGGERGSVFWRGELQKHLAVAREHEAAGRIEEALAAWKEVGRLQSDNPALSAHIRELESLTHDRFIEDRIERGHDLRRQRRYWRAIRAYRAAQRGLSVQDKRAPRLSELIAATTRSHRRILGIYLAAFAVIIAAAASVAKPHLDLRRLVDRCDALVAELASAPPAAIVAAEEEVGALSARADALPAVLRNRATPAVDAVASAAGLARQRARGSAIATAEAALAREDALSALRALAAVAPLGDDPRSVELRAAAEQTQRERAEIATRVARAPALLAAAEAHEAEGSLAAALRAYRELAALPANDATAAATAAVARLEPDALAIERALNEGARLSQVDLAKAATRLAALEAQAAPWERAEELATLREDVAARAAAASAAWKALGASTDEAALQAFLDAHPSAAESGLARSRLAQARSATRGFESAVSAYRASMEAKDWEAAHAAATAIARDHAARVTGSDVRLPLMITSQPPGAAISVDGVAIGVTPLLHTFPVEAKAERMTIALPGYVPAIARLSELRTGWRWEVTLERQAAWSASLGSKPVTGLLAVGEGVVAASGGALVRLGPGGAILWRHALRGDEGIGGGDALRPQLLDAGRIAVSAGESGVEVVGADGESARTWRTRGQARGVVGPYRNDLLGGRARIAVLADALHLGDASGDLSPVALAAPGLSGPVVLGADVDRLLVLADIRGRLIGIDEATQRLAWSADLRAAEVGALVAIDAKRLTMVLDGSRLVCWEASPSAARERWTRTLEAAATGAPVLLDGVIHLAVAAAVVRQRVDGVAQTSWELPSSASAPVAVGGGVVAVGCRQHLAVFADGRLRWSTPLPAPAQAVAIVDGRIVVGLADGTVSAFTL